MSHGRRIRHGMSKTRTHRTWQSMKDRCTNENSPGYSKYGGRGIRVCDRWLDSFEAFLADMGERPPGTSIDRINVDGDCEPGNCRWATQREQCRNRRCSPSQVAVALMRHLRRRGSTLSDLSHAFGLSESGVLRYTEGCGPRRVEFTPDQVAQIRQRVAAGEKQTSVARSLGISLGRVNNIVLGKTYRAA